MIRLNNKNQKPVDQLIKGIVEGNLEQVTAILEKYPNLSKEESWLGEFGMAAMRLAIEKGSIPHFERLQIHIPSINHIDNTEETLLDFACTNGSLSAMKWLIGKGANVDGNIESPICPLISAVCVENTEYVEFLMASGAEINRPHLTSLETPLDLAFSLKNSEISTILEKKGGICTYSPKHFSPKFGNGILQHIQESAGRILPFPKWKTSAGVNIDVMYSLANKAKHILLFTFGLHKRKIHAELCMVVPIEWNPLGGKRGNSFPIEFLLAITNNKKCLNSALNGAIIAKTEESVAMLEWPINVEGFVFIDHKWHPNQKTEPENHPDTATLLTGYPLSKKNINSVLQMEKIAKYPWGKYCIPV
jgi:hypothetical protein